MEDYFPTMAMKPNPECDNAQCRERQAELQQLLTSRPPVAAGQEVGVVNDEVIHESNDWGE